MITNSGILEALIYHKRHRPKKYDFSHTSFFLFLNITREINKIKTNLLSVNKWNIYSLFWKDYGFERFSDPDQYVKNILLKYKLPSDMVMNIILVTMPRVLGYVFNPVSFWLCFDQNDELLVVLSEVNNTFGERHTYLCFNKDLSPIQKNNFIHREKVFHVSPFCEVSGHYKFKFNITPNNMKIDINYYQDNKILISTFISCYKKELSDKKLIKYFFFYPFVTFKVMILIHYHALRLFMKKIPYFKKPIRPKDNITGGFSE